MNRIVLLVFFFAIYITDIYSQCAMCKSVVESNIENGSSIGTGLNDGILYLMIMPYLALFVIAFIWIRYNKKPKF